jgi:hypothetical protein
LDYLAFHASPWWLAIAFAVILCLAIEGPFRSRRFLETSSTLKTDSFTAVQAGLLTLASFVLGLSFSQAQGRYDARRELVVNEANTIGTTWLRSDQLESAKERQFRRILIDYTMTRLEAYQLRATGATAGGKTPYQDQLIRSNRDQDEMWAIVSSALRAHPANLGLSLLMQTLNETIDVSASQLQALTTHVPIAVVELTLILVLLGALSLGLRFAIDGSRPAALSAAYVIASVIVVTMMIDHSLGLLTSI